MWDFTGGMTLLRAYWDAALEVGFRRPGRGRAVRGRPGELAALWRDAGLREITDGSLTISSAYESFDELWESLLAGVGPAGAHVASLDEPRRDALHDALHRRLGSPQGGFELTARAWYALGVV